MMNTAFARPELAAAYCDSLQGRGVLDATSGLFLAGPRRVGKSTFLVNDLIPEIENRGFLPIYVDLWSDKQLDPGLLLVEVVKQAIASHVSKLSKLTKKIKLSKVKLFGSVELNFAEPGLPKNVTLVQLLQYLLAETQKPAVLIVDEAQHALSSANGLNAMFAIKSARDQLKELMLVFTGSSRDKLAQLVIKKDQPFYGSGITEFPLLGKDYIEFFTKQINASLSAENQFSADSVWSAFELTGHRPEILRQLIGQVAINNQAGELSILLAENAELWHSQVWQEYKNDYASLPPLQQAIVELLVDDNSDSAPFSEAALSFYARRVGKPVKLPSVQTAIQALRDKGYVWQSSRGNYALEDDSFAKWLQSRPKC